jgi:hypothetical protein
VPALSIRVFKDRMCVDVFPQILASFSITNRLSSVEPKPLPQPCGLVPNSLRANCCPSIVNASFLQDFFRASNGETPCLRGKAQNGRSLLRKISHFQPLNVKWPYVRTAHGFGQDSEFLRSNQRSAPPLPECVPSKWSYRAPTQTWKIAVRPNAMSFNYSGTLSENKVRHEPYGAKG